MRARPLGSRTHGAKMTGRDLGESERAAYAVMGSGLVTNVARVALSCTCSTHVIHTSFYSMDNVQEKDIGFAGCSKSLLSKAAADGSSGDVAPGATLRMLSRRERCWRLFQHPARELFQRKDRLERKPDKRIGKDTEQNHARYGTGQYEG